MMTKLVLCLIAALVLPFVIQGQENGKLQIHYMSIGQGDGALLVSPLGETVLFDSGDRGKHDLPISYLQQLGVTKIDYHIASHYHDDHIGSAVQVLDAFPLQKKAIDRGGFYKTQTFTNYMEFVGSKRTTAIEGSSITLDAGTAHPVSIRFIALNGNGVAAAKDENDLSLVCLVQFGQFDAVFGGDLSGKKTSKYKDIETSVAPKVGQVEVYKVNHRGSAHSSNENWLDAIKPRIGIISCGPNTYPLPAPSSLQRLHNANVITYWTHLGSGAVTPVAGRDKIGGNIIVEVGRGETTFTVTYAGTNSDTYSVWNPAITPSGGFAWSRRSDVYHFEGCQYVSNISPPNLDSGATPPLSKRLHVGCPK
jgi:competence protein ComEC